MSQLNRRTSPDPNSLGNLARIYGLMNDAQLDSVVAWARCNPDKRIGDGMVELGILSAEQLKFLVDTQRAARSGQPPSGKRDLRAYMTFAIERTRERVPLIERLQALFRRER